MHLAHRIRRQSDVVAGARAMVNPSDNKTRPAQTSSHRERVRENVPSSEWTVGSHGTTGFPGERLRPAQPRGQQVPGSSEAQVEQSQLCKGVHPTVYSRPSISQATGDSTAQESPGETDEH